MKRFSIFRASFASLVLCVLGAVAGCDSAPKKTEPAPAAAAPVLPTAAQPPQQKSLAEMQHELDKKSLEIELARTMALIKFADQSKSPYAQGLVSGLLSGGGGAPGQGQQTQPRASFAQLALQQQQHAAEVDLRRDELAERTSWWNRGLQVTDRLLGFKMFSKGLDQERYRIDQSNSQQRYLFSTLRGTQQDAYGFSSGAYKAGADATLGGFNAAKEAAAAAAAAETTTSTETPAE